MEFGFDVDETLEQLGRIPRAIRFGTVGAILAGVVAGYYFLSYQESRAQFNALEAQAQELQRKLTKARVVANNLSDFEQEVASLERELEVALKQLPDRKQFEDLLQDITTAGKKVGVVIKSIQRKTEVPRGFYTEVPFQIELEGSYHNIAMFFERVAKLSRIVNIGALNVGVFAIDDRETILQVKGTATTFRFVNEKKVAAALSPPYGWRASGGGS
jgi:type IV pilus assembly protein PilO